jgi:hypothetical protein
VQIQDVGVGPCWCGAMGRILDGTYTNVAGRIVWRELRFAVAGLGGANVSDLREIKARLEELRSTQVTSDNLSAALGQHVDKPKSWFSSPSGMAAAAWLAVLIAVVTLILMWKSDQHESGSFTPQQVNEIIQQVRNDPSLQLPTDPTTTPYAPGSLNEGARPPKGHEPCSCGSGKRYRDCCR